MRSWRAIVSVAGGLAVSGWLMLSGCLGPPIPSDQTLAFDHLALGSIPAPTERHTLNDPTLLAAGSLAEAADWPQLLQMSTADAEQFAQTDMRDAALALIVRGPLGPGYTVKVQDVRIVSGVVEIGVTLTDPPPGDPGAAYIAWPHDLIRVALPVLGVPRGTLWRVVADGETLMETTYPP